MADYPDMFDNDFLSRLSSLVRNDKDDFVQLSKIADLDPKVDFREQAIAGIDFGISDLTEFNFSGSIIEHCNFSGAKIRSSSFRDTCISHTKLNRTQHDSIRIRARELNSIVIVPDKYTAILNRLMIDLRDNNSFNSLSYSKKLSIIRDFVEKSVSGDTPNSLSNLIDKELKEAEFWTRFNQRSHQIYAFGQSKSASNGPLLRKRKR